MPLLHLPLPPPPTARLHSSSLSSTWHSPIRFPIVVSFPDGRRRSATVVAAADGPAPSPDGFGMNLREYVVRLERPLGVRFALRADGRFVVHSFLREGNAESSRLIMVGDILKKASNLSDDGFVEMSGPSNVKKLLKEKTGSCSLLLERPFSPFPVQQFHLKGDLDVLFNKGQIPVATWNRNILAQDLLPLDGNGNSGLVVFSPRFLNSNGLALLSSNDNHSLDVGVVGIFSEEGFVDSEWTSGDFAIEEYMKALNRAKDDLYYDHSRGMQYSKITEQIFVGSCIQSEADVQSLSNVLGITAILNFQSEKECEYWEINSEYINKSCQQYGVLMVNYPIRQRLDLREKLPFSVGLLVRLLRKGFRVYVTCTTGVDISPSCVIAYLHWVQDIALDTAYTFLTERHSCMPNRSTIVWATWDLIALVEAENYDGPPTHVVNFIWKNGCPEGLEVYVVGDFTGNWKEPVKAEHKSGPRYEAEIKVRHGRYKYKFIIGDQWKHSTDLPMERDERGIVNNVIRVGSMASIKLPGLAHQYIKDPTNVEAIERPLTEDERFMLVFASQRVAFSICPIRLTPK